ncbi:MAG TPA: hypothetical protein VF171_05315, partial [Trueperaceae bacterium]
MVSARVATRILDQVLAGRGLSADSIAPDDMEDLILGPIFGELETILPREGLRRNLEALAVSIRAQEAGGIRDVAAARNQQTIMGSAPKTPVPPAAVRSRLASTLILDQEPEIAADEAPGVAEAPIAPLLRQIESELSRAGGTPAAGAARARSAKRETPTSGTAVAAMRPPGETLPPTTSNPTPKSLDGHKLEEAVLRFAQLENVTLVAALHGDGSVALSRGSGSDLDALARYSHLGLSLLRRRGNLRSYYLAHSRGQLFLFPVGTHTLIIVGSPDLNIGAVFTALTGLKEEA